MSIHTERMTIAMKQAITAYHNGEVPIGCVIYHKNTLIGKAYNQTEQLCDPTAHCEMLALTSAFEAMNSKHLKDCSMYVTLEPCPMCAGAIVLSRIDNLYFASYDLKAGACGSVIDITNNKSLNHKVNVYGGIMDSESSTLLKTFFQQKRNNKKKGNDFFLN